MLVNTESAEKRLSSSSNLMNKLREGTTLSKNKSMQLFGVGQKKEERFVNPFAPKPIEVLTTAPTIDDLIDDVDSRLNLDKAHKKALHVMNRAIQRVSDQIEELDSPTKLADVAAKMGKIVTDIRNEKKNSVDKERTVHYHIYTPEQKKITDFEEITV